jgi:hypothetical protein
LDPEAHRSNEPTRRQNLDDHVDGAANDLHPLRISGRCCPLPLEGSEIGIVDFGNEFIRGSSRRDPERRLGPSALSALNAYAGAF